MVSKKGIALIFVLGVVSVLLLISLSYVFLVSNELSMASRIHDEIQAYYYAEAAIARKTIELKQNDSDNINIVFSFPYGDQWLSSASASVADISTGGAGALKTYKITGRGFYKGAVRQVETTIRETSIANYAYITGSENYSVSWTSSLNGAPHWFSTGDVIQGPLHTNGSIHIAGDPAFNGPVTTVGNEIIYHPGNNNPDLQTLTLGVPEVVMPTAATYLSPISLAAKADANLTYPNGWVLKGGTMIMLNGTTMTVKNLDRYGDDKFHANESLPLSNAIYVEGGDVMVAGVLDGQLTIGTDQEIHIAGNLTYASDPLKNTDSDDILGLVAERDVIIMPGVPYNASIYAYIVAINGSFSVRNAESVLNGVLTTVGGVASNNAGIIGIHGPNGEQLKTGYNEDKKYDERIKNGKNPPYFPVAQDSIGTKYQKLGWVDRGGKLE